MDKKDRIRQLEERIEHLEAALKDTLKDFQAAADILKSISEDYRKRERGADEEGKHSSAMLFAGTADGYYRSSNIVSKYIDSAFECMLRHDLTELIPDELC